MRRGLCFVGAASVRSKPLKWQAAYSKRQEAGLRRHLTAQGTWHPNERSLKTEDNLRLKRTGVYGAGALPEHEDLEVKIFVT
jgi:hypothetical protein